MHYLHPVYAISPSAQPHGGRALSLVLAKCPFVVHLHCDVHFDLYLFTDAWGSAPNPRFPPCKAPWRLCTGGGGLLTLPTRTNRAQPYGGRSSKDAPSLEHTRQPKPVRWPVATASPSPTLCTNPSGRLVTVHVVLFVHVHILTFKHT